MKKRYSIIQRAVVITAMAVGLFSCIDEGRENCIDPRGNVRLTVQLDADIASRNNSNSYQIDSVHVYVFNQSNRYVTSTRGGVYTNGQPYEFFLNLDDGQYHFIVWTNPGDYYQASHSLNDCEYQKPLLQDLQYYLACPEDQCLREEIPDLLHGIYRDATIVLNRDNHFTISMIPDMYRINIKVKGLPDTEDTFDFSITDNNSHYSFENSIIADKSDFQHIRTCTTENGELNTSIKVLQLADNRSPKFQFRNTTLNEILFDKCLVETIQDAYKTAGQVVDFNTTHTFDIVLTYDTELGVSVSVNGWNYNPQPGEL